MRPNMNLPTAITHDNPIPTPPFWGSKCIEHIPLKAILPYINKTALYKFQWGYKPKDKTPEIYRAWAKQELDPILHRLVETSDREKILRPQAIYGFFPCVAEGDDLVIFSNPEEQREICRFHFPRQKTERRLCIADFFRPADQGQWDVVAFHLVTIGQGAADHARQLFTDNAYQEYLYWHGLNAEGAEGLAEYIHKRVRVELGFGREDARDIDDLIKQKYRGSRYSFGYPACPNLADQDKILMLLQAERIGVTLGEEAQLWPEDSTTAIICHHPQAKYFGV